MRRVILTLGLVTFILGAARLALGPPDLGRSFAFFDGGIPTLLAGESVMVLVAWIVIIVSVFGLLIGVTHFVERSQLLQRPSARAGILLAAGLVLLAVGAVHHALPSVSMCCGSGAAAIREAIHLAQ